MSSVAASSTPVLGTPHRTRVAIGATVGTTIENYDFIGYGTAAGLYFGHAFFPDQDPVTATLLSFATLGVGFAARPLGGILGGYLGDKLGRKPVLIASLLVMGLSTFAIGLLPTYATVGLLAPILLVAVRIVQGLAFGAEWGSAILMTYEHAPWSRKGQFGAVPQAGFPLGLLLANLAFLASAPLPGDWAWRVPFLLSALLVGAGIYIRLRITESPEFQTAKAEGDLEANPLASVIRRDWRNLLRAFGMRIAETAGYAVAVTYLTSYVRNSGFASTRQTILALVLAAALGFPATLLWGRLTDQVGRKPVYLFGTIAMIVMGVPFFLMVQSAELALVVAVFVLSFAVIQNSLAGTQSAWFPELFSTGTRSSGASLAYQLAAVISGFTAFWCVSLFEAYGWIGPALLYCGYGAVGLVAALSTPETFGARQRQEAAAATRSATGSGAGAAELRPDPASARS